MRGPQKITQYQPSCLPKLTADNNSLKPTIRSALIQPGQLRTSPADSFSALLSVFDIVLSFSRFLVTRDMNKRGTERDRSPEGNGQHGAKRKERGSF